MTGLLAIYDALVAYVSVEMFSSKNKSLGFMHAIIKEYEFPPIDCFKIDVSFESLYGTYVLSYFFIFELFF